MITLSSLTACIFCNNNIIFSHQQLMQYRYVNCVWCKKINLKNTRYDFFKNDLMQISFAFDEYLFAISTSAKNLFCNGKVFVIPIDLLNILVKYIHKNNLNKFIELNLLLI